MTALAPFSPEWRAKIERLAHDGDDFWLGAQWMLDQINAHQPPETPGASSCPKENPVTLTDLDKEIER